MASTQHIEQVANERANLEVYNKFLESLQRPDVSTIAVSASANFTRSGLSIVDRLPTGKIVGRVQLAKGSKGIDLTNLYIGPRRARCNDLRFKETDEHRFEVFSWAAPIASVFYTGHYSLDADIEIEAGVIRSLIFSEDKVSDLKMTNMQSR